MEIIEVGKFHCEHCDKDITVTLHSDYSPDVIEEERVRIMSSGENYHWYDYHYNCAACGKWIPSGERELLLARHKNFALHKDYSQDGIDSALLRIHKACLEKLIK